MTKPEQIRRGKVLWAIADPLRGSMNADAFRDCILVLGRKRFAAGFLLKSAAAVLLAAVWVRGAAIPRKTVGWWAFEGNLRDRSACANDAYADAAAYAPGHNGRALRCANRPALVPDCPELRLAPGLRLECWVKFTKPSPDIREIITKPREYMLRVDPAGEGGGFSFFVYLDDAWEPRVRSEAAPRIGEWHHLVAGWDGKAIFIEVDGKRVTAPRSGQPAAPHEALRLGAFRGLLDEVRIDNPGAKKPFVARWPFDGDVRDRSGHGHDGAAAGRIRFSPGRLGRALGPLAQPLEVPDRADLRLAPGLGIDCRVYVEKIPDGIQTIVAKDGEYMLRINPPQEGSGFAFFVMLDGKWEPRVEIPGPVEPGKWRRLTARWDGRIATLEVNGHIVRRRRSGVARPGSSPLLLGGPGLRLDELRIENPRRPVLAVRRIDQEHAILRVGVPETLTAAVWNLGKPAKDVGATLDLPPGVRCLDAPTRELGDLDTGAKKTLAWRIAGDRETSGAALVRLTSRNSRPATFRHPLAFFPAADADAIRRARLDPPCSGGKSYYIDSRRGDNRNAGTSPGAAWKDFTNINGKTLGPGQRLLIRRGSVIDQELVLSARGTPGDWAEIAAYGAGARPIIRRNWDIDDRCVLIQDPDYLRIQSLVVCCAGKGLVVHCRTIGHAGLIIEDCIAHHIEGLYRPNANGIPEWRDRHGAPGDDLNLSAGFALSGAPIRDAVIRDCEMFQTSWGFFATGDDIILDRLYCHDNYVLNTSPHPALVGVSRSYLLNSVFDAPGWHASAGSMGIMLVAPRGLIIRNCTWRNQPDSGSADQGGIDFEARGSGCLIDRCTFENNAGAAIEVLGLKSPQARNLEIRNSRFIKNNWAKKLGPSEIYVWGKAPDPEVCCSTGRIHDNGYVLLPGVQFFVNEAPRTTRWTLRNNTAYASAAELDRAMPYNAPPKVDAGPPVCASRSTLRLDGKVRDDGRPGPRPPRVRWERLEGPGEVQFQNPEKPDTPAAFSRPGDYLLRLVGDDGELWTADTVAVHILPQGVRAVKAWEFDRPLDKEGWTEANTGTKKRIWNNPQWPTRSEPVKYVAGGYYIIALENASNAYILSPDNLGVDLARADAVRIRFQNHTPATHMRIRFITAGDRTWNDAKSRIFAVTPEDNVPQLYTVDMRKAWGRRGRLERFRLDFATGKPLTGTCRIDYIILLDTGAPARIR